MSPADEDRPERSGSDQIGEDDLHRKEQELLTKARETARRIAERVRKTLADTDSHASLPTEEKPPLA